MMQLKRGKRKQMKFLVNIQINANNKILLFKFQIIKKLKKIEIVFYDDDFKRLEREFEEIINK
jgi:hypothetical protein